MSHKNVHFSVGSYIKFYFKSAKSHIGNIEKLPILKHGPFKQNHCAIRTKETKGSVAFNDKPSFLSPPLRLSTGSLKKGSTPKQLRPKSAADWIPWYIW